jgi:general secretion pathway protein I
MKTQQRNRTGKKAGFTLLEVILALAILAGSIAVLGEASRMALRNAGLARDMAHAQMLCESVLAQIVIGVTPAESTDKTPFDETITDSVEPDEAPWVYTIEVGDTDEPGLISARVTVTRDMPPERHPVQFSLVRWLPDPNATSTSQNSQSGTSGSGSAVGGLGAN